MHFRRLVFAGAVFLLTLVPGHAIAQSGAKWTPARTADGQPDLHGIWANNNATPFERPKELAGRALLTEQEVAALRQKAGDLFSGQSDAAFGDTLFLSVLANVQGTKSGFTSTE